MNTVENTLLQQMQKLASTFSAVPGAGNKSQNNQSSVSFQEMLQQSGNKTSSSESAGKEPQDKPLKEAEEALEEAKSPELPVKQKDEEELKAENLTGNPNAVGIMDLFRPEIVENVEQAGTVVNPIPQETVEGAAMDLGDQAPAMDTGVDAGIGAEVSMEQQPKDFQQAMEEAPQQPMTEGTAQTQQQEAPQQSVQETEKPQEAPEVQVERAEDSEEPTGEAGVTEQPVFHEAEAVPVKVGERYETVDTQAPEMDDQMADIIRTAIQTGQDRIEIRLNPQNLGSLVIQMTKDTAGVLQVVLHAASPKAEGLLNQHLNSLHSALQAYGHEEIRIEVQRGGESQQQDFRQADPDGRGQHQHRQQQERQEERQGGEEFMQKLRLGLFGLEE